MSSLGKGYMNVITLPDLVARGLAGERSRSVMEAMDIYLNELRTIKFGDANFYEIRASLQLILSGHTPRELYALAARGLVRQDFRRVDAEVIAAVGWLKDLNLAKSLRHQENMAN